MPFNTFRPGELETRALGTLDQRIIKLRGALEVAGIPMTESELRTTEALTGLTDRLSVIEEQSYHWRCAAVELISVAEVWPDRRVASHVLGWAKSL